MPRLNPNLFADEDYELYLDRGQRRSQRHKRPKQPGGQTRRQAAVAPTDLTGQPEALEDQPWTYRAARHEHLWLTESLGAFYEQQWLRDVLRLLKGGKEASVYLCQGDGVTSPPLLAAKVYRPSRFRSLKKDHLYREGRARLDADGNQIVDSNSLHAIARKSEYGLKLMRASWIEHEYQALSRLHQAGADVPRPYARGDNAILMGYIGDERQPAPTLNTQRLGGRAAQALFERVIANVDTMLSLGFVHGDLSAFNILYWEGAITLIDFPQVVDPYHNRSAYQIFRRDIQRVGEYFSAQGLRVAAGELAKSLWARHRLPLRPDVHPALLDDEDETDREYWRRYEEED